MEKQKERQNKKNSRCDILIEKASRDLVNSIEEVFKYEEFVLEYLGEDAVKGRLYFMRHGETVEAKEENKEMQTSDAELTEDSKKEIKDKGKELNAILGEGDCCILYDDNTVRTKETGILLGESMGISCDLIKSVKDGLKTSNKKLGHKKQAKIRAASDTVDFIVDFKDDLERQANFNIIFSIHRGNIGGIEQVFLQDSVGPTVVRSNKMKNLEIREIDLGINNETISPIVRKDILFINNINYKGILDQFEEEEELKPIIDQFYSQDLQIWELQNYINAYFKSKPGLLYKKYFPSDSHDLRVFCIANLVKNGEFEVVKNNFRNLLNKESETSLIKLVDSLFQIFDDAQIKKFIDALAGYNKVGSWLNEEVKKKKLEFYLNYREFTLDNIEEIRKKTLDKRIMRGEDVVIPLGFERDKYNTIEKLVNGNGTIVIEGEAGAGKSTKLLEIMEYLRPNDKNILFPIYVSLGGKTLKAIEKNITAETKGLLGDGKYKFIYLFDALDEAKWTDEERKQFMKYIKELSGTVIITSRPNNINKDEIGFEKLSLKPLDKKQIDEYVSSHLGEEQQETWKKWKEQEFIQGIESNPLMLSIICNLLADGKGISRIENKKDLSDKIENIKDLYDKIVDKRLLEWEKSKLRNALEKLEIRKELLSYIAYSSYHNEGLIDEKTVNDIIDNGNYTSAVSRETNNGDLIRDLDSLNMVFKKNDEGEYCFIHESFSEYFLVKYLCEELGKNQKFSLTQIIEEDSSNDSLNEKEEVLNEDLSVDQIIEDDYGNNLYKKEIDLLIKFGGERGKQIIISTLKDSNIKEKRKLELLISIVFMGGLDIAVEIFESESDDFKEESIVNIGIYISSDKEGVQDKVIFIDYIGNKIDNEIILDFYNKIYLLSSNFQKNIILSNIEGLEKGRGIFFLRNIYNNEGSIETKKAIIENIYYSYYPSDIKTTILKDYYDTEEDMEIKRIIIEKMLYGKKSKENLYIILDIYNKEEDIEIKKKILIFLRKNNYYDLLIDFLIKTTNSELIVYLIDLFEFTSNKLENYRKIFYKTKSEEIKGYLLNNLVLIDFKKSGTILEEIFEKGEYKEFKDFLGEKGEKEYKEYIRNKKLKSYFSTAISHIRQTFS